MPDSDDIRRLAHIRRLCVSGEARRIREAHGIHAREMAAAVGVSHTTLIRWETGQVRPRTQVALRLLDELEALGDPIAVPPVLSATSVAMILAGAVPRARIDREKLLPRV